MRINLDFAEFSQSRSLQLAACIGLAALVFVLARWVVPAGFALTQRSSTEPTTVVASVESPSSLAPRIPADKVAISMPSFNANALLQEVRAGDRMDVIALFPDTNGASPTSAVIVRGAEVLAPPAPEAGTPIVFVVSPQESMVVAHLVHAGTRLTYSLWPQAGAPAAVKPMAAEEVRTRLGLVGPTETVSPPASPTPEIIPTVVASP